MTIGKVIGSNCTVSFLNEYAYEVHIHFKLQNQSSSEQVFVFKEEQKPSSGAVVDVFTKNAVCHKSLVKKIFTRKEVQEATDVVKQFQASQVEGTKVAVFDLQNPITRYLPAGEIADCENVVQTFFTQKYLLAGHPKKVHELFQRELKVDYLLCEGSLKTDILMQGGLEDHQITYLNSSEGALGFCGFTEYFMHGLKLGHTITTPSKNTLEGSKYFKAIGTEEAYKPRQSSTVFYPFQYRDMYSVTGKYAKSLADSFTVSGRYYESTKISILNTALKV
ncbi:MAG: hypothetical protein WC222_05230 [Parachlamydiales bacterium]|jgi:hypothetical protein